VYGEGIYINITTEGIFKCLTGQNEWVWRDELHGRQSFRLSTFDERVVIGPVVKLIRKVPIQVDIVRVGSADTTPVDLEVDLSNFFVFNWGKNI